MPALTMIRRIVGRRLRQVCRFAGIDSRRRALLVEAGWWLLLARLALMTVPFSRIAPRLGRFVPPDEGRLRGFPLAPPAGPSELARDVGWAVTLAARHVPFKAVCLPQAMAAKAMLGRRGVVSVLSFGVARTPRDGLEAHAWLAAAGVEVTGFAAAESFTEIGCFV